MMRFWSALLLATALVALAYLLRPSVDTTIA